MDYNMDIFPLSAMKPMMKTEAVFHFYVNINDKHF